MNAAKAIEDLRKGLGDAGFRMGLVPLERLADLKSCFAEFLESGSLDRAFHEDHLAGFDSEPPEDFPQARSVILTAARQPKVRVRFRHSGREYCYVIPPTYDHSTDEIELEKIREILKGHPFEIRPARLPWKTLAVRSGLASYGRNNIAYFDDWGSYVRLFGFYSDIPCDEDDWQGARAMKACEKCRLCLTACPSEAISQERFLIRAERCITLHNEDTREFPEWIDPRWHNSLVGCMICQDVCPANRENLDWLEGDVEFSEEETALILEGTPPEDLPAGTVENLRVADLLEMYEILPRNLRVLLDNIA